MGRWRKIQKKLIERSVEAGFDFIQKDISIGKVYGTIYYKKGKKPKRGVLLIPGMSNNRYAFGPLARRLASYGFFCLSIDLPSHYKNPTKLTLSNLSETITEGVIVLKKKYGMDRVAVVGHSIGSVGALFSSLGYNNTIEKEIYILWEEISALLKKTVILIEEKKADRGKLELLSSKIEETYSKIKKVILKSLIEGVKRNTNVLCYVLMAMPRDCKAAMPGMQLLKKMKFSWIKKLNNTIVTKGMLKQAKDANFPSGQFLEEKRQHIRMMYFKSLDIYEFLDYFTKMREPANFLALLEKLMKFSHKEEQVSLIEYYHKKYLLKKPKLFVYGMRDIALKPFLPFARKKLEDIYMKAGAKKKDIIYGDFSHALNENPKQQLTTILATNKGVTKDIIKFIDRYV